MLNVCRRNAEFYINRQYEFSDKSKVIFEKKEELSEIIMHRDNYIYTILYSINHLIKEDTFKDYIFVEYNDLVSKPGSTLKNIYNFFDIKHFKHNFNNIKEFEINGVKYDDSVLGGKMHTVKTGKLERQEYQVKVPQRVVDKYSGLELWRKINNEK